MYIYIFSPKDRQCAFPVINNICVYHVYMIMCISLLIIYVYICVYHEH